jgi:hypothetical protein
MKQEKLSSVLAATELGGEARNLLPALKGSLAKVYKPCIRENCAVCQRGEKHPAWILSVSQNGRRRCLYVPEELVPVLKRGIQNGRKIEEWLSNQGPKIVKDFRLQRDRAITKKKRTPKS